MAAGAVASRDVVRSDVFVLSVTGETLGAIKVGALFGRWRSVGIVTAHARHARPTGDPALAGLELLDLTDSALGCVLAGVDEVGHEVGEFVARFKVEYGAVAAFNICIAFEMADTADAVSLCRRELDGVGDRSVSAGGNVLAAIPVAVLADYPYMFEGQTTIEIVSSLYLLVYAAHVAAQTAWVDC